MRAGFHPVLLGEGCWHLWHMSWACINTVSVITPTDRNSALQLQVRITASFTSSQYTSLTQTLWESKQTTLLWSCEFPSSSPPALQHFLFRCTRKCWIDKINGQVSQLLSLQLQHLPSFLLSHIFLSFCLIILESLCFSFLTFILPACSPFVLIFHHLKSRFRSKLTFLYHN